MQLVTLSLGTPLGLLAVICGVILFFATRGKGTRPAVTVIAVCLIVLGALAIVIGALSVKPYTSIPATPAVTIPFAEPGPQEVSDQLPWCDPSRLNQSAEASGSSTPTPLPLGPGATSHAAAR
jgi:hypothetical protein